ncbi:adenosylcobinamide-phosphate synthase CbiB [Marinomonas posidonica]|uniref:Cobalamin biosynthesis protein CobD n=1 Tax=Marinomonas posidonica (strain CECT 7376 / NCIMB 14433 / IVIA-Po-181) TaxID=491952 RepID=F6CZR4_MARPP|nr:adenosylcobinamide-phosphate synthase CbiB [Marinomonas posidonica]AEF53575.1 Cobalamin biosynthesis protein cbiB [Marinomonas posidonica IVIA-Po-181]
MMTSIFDFISTNALILIIALLLDRLIGEPKSWHPLVWFGRWVDLVRQYTMAPQTAKAGQQKRAGVFAWGLAVIPWLLVLYALFWLLPTWLDRSLAVLIVYFAIGWQSLREHAFAIAEPLQKASQGDSSGLQQARQAVGYIVSRDTQNLGEEEIAKAGIESVLENGSDAIFAPIFWFVIAGVPGILLYRLANTLDAMWGYKNNTFIHFGWFAARFDDVLNYLPARLVVFTYGACGEWHAALRSARRPSASWKSPNAGPVMASGAGALGIQVGGSAAYFGKMEERPILGEGEQAQPKDLVRAVELVDRSVYLWGFVICLLF